MQQDSVYHYKRGHFREYIKRIADKSITVSTALSTFREITSLSNKFRNMTIHELADNPQLMLELYYALRNGMSPESQYRLPYKKVEREKELVENIAEVYDIDKDKTQSKVITSHYKNEETGQEFNYAIEVVIAPRRDLNIVTYAGEYEFIGNINSTPSIDGGSGYFYDGPFNYIDKNGDTQKTSSIHNVLYNCGFISSGDYYSKTKKKVPCVIFINVKTPCPDWLGSAGKTKIDMKPYAADIADIVYKLTRKIPSYHPKEKIVVHDYRKTQKEATDYLIDFLNERKAAVDADPSLKTKDRLTQSTVWYRIRPVMIDNGFVPRKNWGITRKSLTGEINKVCREEIGVDREELGIIAAARATMLYRGVSIPVTYDNLKALAENGVVIIVIEKEGIADVLVDYAAKYGVALVHTKGRLTEYGKDFIEAAKEANSIISILVDFDLVGHRIYKSTKSETHHIGITRETVTWLQENGYPNLTEEEVEEEYNVELTQEDDPKEVDKYLLRKRIELDSIVAKVGAEGLWNYIKYKLESELGPFNYTGDVSMPAYESLYSSEMADLITYLHDYVQNVVSDTEDDVMDNELLEAEKLIDIEEKENELQERFESKVSEDTGVKTINEEIKKLLERLPKFDDNIHSNST